MSATPSATQTTWAAIAADPQANAATVVQPDPVKSTDGRDCNSRAADSLCSCGLFELARAIEGRAQFGFGKYGELLRPHNGRSFAVDAYQEALDLIAYLKGDVMEGEGDVRTDLLAAMALAERIRVRAERDFAKRIAAEKAKVQP